jgi:hypothetical protein
MKKKATEIRVTRAEGPSRLCVTKTFTGDDCWKHANQWLWSSAFSFPREGGYDKHDVFITFEDGEVYQARMDCQHFTCDYPDLDIARHVRRHLLFVAEHSREAAKFLEEYEIPTSGLG